MTKVTVTVEADSPEQVQAALRALSGGEATEKTVTPGAGTKAAAGASPKETDTPDGTGTTTTTETVTLETIKAMAAEKKNERAKIKALLGSFGAESIGTLSPDNYGAFYLKLQKI